MPKRLWLAIVLVLAVAAPFGASGDSCATPCVQSGENRTARWLYELPEYGFTQGIDASFNDDTHVTAGGIQDRMSREFRFYYSYSGGSYECTPSPAGLTGSMDNNGGFVIAVASGDSCLGGYTFKWVATGPATTTDSPLVTTAPPGAEVGKRTTWTGSISYTLAGWPGEYLLPGSAGTTRHEYTVKAG